MKPHHHLLLHHRHLLTLTLLLALSAFSLQAFSPSLAAAATPAVPAGVTTHIYKKIPATPANPDRELHAYIVNPPGWKATDKRPAIVFFHGGSFISGTPLQFAAEQGAYLASRGMVAIGIEYRLLKPTEKVAPIVCNQDAKSAMRWVYANAEKLGIDPARIAASGGSAGGEMAAFVALTPGFDDPADDLKIPTKPAALVLFNPAIAVPEGNAAALNALAAEHFGPEGGSYFLKVAPARYLDAKAPPMIIMSGEKDRLVPMAFLKKFAASAKDLGVRCDTVFYAGQGHAFFHKDRDGGKYYYGTLLEIDNFLASLGWLQGLPTIKPPSPAPATVK